jgi:hypothetical protein
MKTLKKILVILVAAIFALGLVIMATGYWVYENPKKAWDFIGSHFLPEDLIVTWVDLNSTISLESGPSVKIKSKINGLKIEKKNSGIEVPVESLEIDVTILPFSNQKPFLFHNVIILASKPIRIRMPESDNSKLSNPAEQLEGIIQKIRVLSSYMAIEDLEIKIDKFTLEQAHKTVLEVNLEANTNNVKSKGSLFYKTRVSFSSGIVVSSNGEISLNNRISESVQFKSKLEIHGKGLDIDQDITGNLSEVSVISTSGQIRYKKNKLIITGHPQFSIEMTPQNLNIKLVSDVHGLSRSFFIFDNLKAQFNIPMERGATWSSEASQLSIYSMIKLFPNKKTNLAVIERACSCRVDEQLQVRIEGPVWISNLFANDAQIRTVFDLSFRFEDVINKLFKLKLAGGLQMESTLSRFDFKPRLNINSEIFDFGSVAQILDIYKVLMPAPFDILKGNIILNMNGPIEIKEQYYVFPVKVETRLKSEDQIVNLGVLTKISLNSNFKSAEIDSHLFIHQLTLQLPPLNPTKGKPRILPDKRISPNPPVLTPKSSFKVSLSFEISTDQPGSIHLLSEYFKPYVPLTINVARASDRTNSGFLKLEKFDIKYLRRRMTVEKMSIDFSEANEKKLIVDGRLSVQQTQYKIFIDVNGLADHLNIVFSSEPYLPRSEIINVLIYDRTSDQLATADVSTSGQIESAVVDRAIGLFGIWAFASTPIRGFSYNPSTKVYVAMIEVSKGVTARIGTTFEAASQLELQKRISRSWMLTVAWTPADQNESESTKLVLQWEKRFK